MKTITSERRINSSDIAKVVTAQQPHYNPNAPEGIKQHRVIAAKVLLNAQPVLEGFGTSKTAIKLNPPEIIIKENRYLCKLPCDLTISTRTDLEVGILGRKTIIEVKPNLSFAGALQAITTCFVAARQTKSPVEGGIYSYRDNQFRLFPKGGSKIWHKVEEIADVAETLLSYQRLKDSDKETRTIIPAINRTDVVWQPGLPGMNNYQNLLAPDERIKLSKKSIELRRSQLDPLISEVRPVINQWLNE